jgi:hypothetical protein
VRAAASGTATNTSIIITITNITLVVVVYVIGRSTRQEFGPGSQSPPLALAPGCAAVAAHPGTNRNSDDDAAVSVVVSAISVVSGVGWCRRRRRCW